MRSGEGAGLLLRNVELDGTMVDVELMEGLVSSIGSSLEPMGHPFVVEGAGGALIPGLHDHHIHLMATAAALGSVSVGPPEVRDPTSFRQALRAAAATKPGDWIRAVGYHEGVAGDIDRSSLDRFVDSHCVRIQDRSGARWTLNSRAIAALGIESLHHPAVERDESGRATGRLHRGDDLLRDLLGAATSPDLTELGQSLARYGVTGVTDTTPYRTPADLQPLLAAVVSGALPQRLLLTGGPGLLGQALDLPAGVELGPVKIVIDDADYPSPDEIASTIELAHQHRRPVAIHCVTRVATALAIAAWDSAGSIAGDRVEHGSVLSPDLVEQLSSHGITVVTQPGFIAERGDEYLRDVAADDQAHLYPCASLLAGGVAVAGSTDSPYSALDPWLAMRAAVTRETRSGHTIGAAERVEGDRAMGLFLGDPLQPGGARRSIEVGSRGDLCLLRVPLAVACKELDARNVAATVALGQWIYQCPEGDPAERHS